MLELVWRDRTMTDYFWGSLREAHWVNAAACDKNNQVTLCFNGSGENFGQNCLFESTAQSVYPNQPIYQESIRECFLM